MQGADDDAAKDEAMKVVLLRQGLPKFFDIDVDDDLTGTTGDCALLMVQGRFPGRATLACCFESLAV